ncbi:helix-turn-helix transcriptional regulator [Paraburkholderia sprentiae WSM5005]|uniref:Helix-turn-helix transcriptional regulator n=1 Tax=Paraburkholderia sprentiae WSM5005 TaxID=754502 RepID=A0A8F4KI57_9BURK|nr:helix-turn-helix domain-containing protein [Paraburkholderia sprentiae]QXE07319.1 helix-turn-helix transcriptional regulator [Paraburkholderia sprentiae WSM5005]
MKRSATGCSVEEAMRLLGGRWRLLLVSYLLDGPKRFNDLRRDVPGISQRMLTLDLRALEQVGLVQRTVFAEVPVKVEYQLTEDGQRLIPVVEVMRDFGLWLKSRPEPAPETAQVEAEQVETMDRLADRPGKFSML